MAFEEQLSKDMEKLTEAIKNEDWLTVSAYANKIHLNALFTYYRSKRNGT